jgi:hypothetical protein
MDRCRYSLNSPRLFPGDKGGEERAREIGHLSEMLIGMR